MARVSYGFLKPGTEDGLRAMRLAEPRHAKSAAEAETPSESDGSQYKEYVLVLLFTKYISDKYAGHFGRHLTPTLAPHQAPDASRYAVGTHLIKVNLLFL